MFWKSDDIVIGVFLDSNKVFDTFPYDILLKKSYTHEIADNAFILLKSNLTDRIEHCRLFPCSFMVESSRVKLRTVLPIVISKFKPKYAEQKLLGLH